MNKCNRDYYNAVRWSHPGVVPEICSNEGMTALLSGNRWDNGADEGRPHGGQKGWWPRTKAALPPSASCGSKATLGDLQITTLSQSKQRRNLVDPMSPRDCGEVSCINYSLTIDSRDEARSEAILVQP